MRKQSLIYKICFSSLFIALTIILSRFFALPGLFGFSFLKISLANSVVMFSSFYLGPIWGLIVGGASDVFGALLYPQGGAFNPLYTIPALFTGLCPFLFYKLLEIIKIDKKFPITLTFLLSLFSIFILIFFIFNDYVISGSKVYNFDLWMKIVFIVLGFGLSALYIVAVFIIKYKFKDKKVYQNYNIYNLVTSMFLTYFIVKIPLGSLIQSFLLNYSFLFIFFIRLLAGFFSCIVHSIIVIIALNVSGLFNIRSAINEDNYFRDLFKWKKKNVEK